MAAKQVPVGAKPGMAAHTAGKHYADPGYQPDGRKRYALDTPEECRAALSYIGMPKNRAKYKAADLAKVESAIHAAARKFGIDAGTPSMMGAARRFVATAKAKQAGKVVDPDGIPNNGDEYRMVGGRKVPVPAKK